MLALSVRQPFAELILRGIKTAELRTRSTTIIGERFYIYATKRKSSAADGLFAADLLSAGAWSDDLRPASPPGWMIELAKQVKMIGLEEDLPRGLIVGSAVIEKVIPPSCEGDLYQWVLTDVERLRTPRKPQRQPQPVWFRPA